MKMDTDWEIRLAAFAALDDLRRREGGVVTSLALREGFVWNGERIPFRDRGHGIWRPRQLGSDGAALSVLTSVPRKGRLPRYDDQIGADRSYFVYRYEGDDPGLYTNRAVRNAMVRRRPIIYFYGLQPEVYYPIYPTYVTSESEGDLAFHLQPAAQIQPESVAPDVLRIQREYTTVAVKRRLHQERFAELVMRAYKQSCSICRIKHRQLLDAAHIIEDRDELGVAEISNGLALCRIHHAAYDSYILGVDPDYRIHIRNDILQERDGPMLKHGLQEMDGKTIHTPREIAMKPNPEFLDWRFTRFKSA